MKIKCGFKLRLLSGLVLLLLWSGNFLQAEVFPTTVAYRGDTVRIIKTNWFNSMGCFFDQSYQPCVELAADNEVFFRIRVRTSTNDVTPFPNMRVRYFLYADRVGGTVIQGVTDEITNAMLLPVTLENGESAYEATFTITVNLEADCVADDNYYFKTQYLLVESVPLPAGVSAGYSSFGAYPVGDHPTLFPSYPFIVHSSGDAQLVEESKQICCFDPDNPPKCSDDGSDNGGSESGGSGGGLGGGLRQAAPESFVVYPNPFEDAITGRYQMEGPGMLNLTVLDAQGRLLVQQNQPHTSAGAYNIFVNSSDWPVGVYYLRFQTEQETKTLKVVKLNK